MYQNDQEYYDNRGAEMQAEAEANAAADYAEYASQMHELEHAVESKLSIFQVDKEERKQFVSLVVDAVQNGAIDPRKIHYQLKCAEELVAAIKESPEYKESLVTECQKQGKKHDFFNASFEVAELGTKYQYAQCNDPLLPELERAAKEASDKLKERQEFLKKIPIEGIEVRHEDELVRVYPPSKYSTTGVKVSLK